MVSCYIHSHVRQGLPTCAEPDWVFNESTFDFRVQCGHTLVVKRNFAAYEDIENYSETPDVYFGTGVYFCIEKFWSCKVKRAAEGCEVCDRIKKIGQPKVDDFDVASLRD